MYAVDFTDRFIIPLNGVNDHELRSYQKYDSFKEAKHSLLCYWQDIEKDAGLNIKAIRKMTE